MALNYSELSAATRELYVPLIVSSIEKKDPLLSKLIKGKKVASGGTKIVQTIRHDDLTTGSYAKGSTFDISPKEILTAAEFGIKGEYATMSIDGFEDAMNSGSNAVHNLLEEKSKAMADSLRKRMAKSLFGQGTDANSFEGLDKILADDNVYGGIDRTAHDFWKAQVFRGTYDSGSATYAQRAVTIQLLQNAYMKVTNGGEDQDGAIMVVGFDMFNKIYDLIMSTYRTVQNDDELVKFGFQAIKFNGVPVLASPYVVDNDIRLINTNYIHFRPLKNRDFHMTDFKESQTTDARAAQLLVAGNFTVSKSKAQGIVKDLDPNL